MIRKFLALSLSTTLILSGCGQGTLSTPPGNGNANTTPPPTPPTSATSSSVIKHVVVIFGENISFDHYFGTYPNALNLPGEPQFTAAAGTPVPNNYVSNPNLLSQNPNLSTNGAINAKNSALGAATNPFRLDRAQAATADQSHAYTAEQNAFDNGLMDLFPASTGSADSAAVVAGTDAPAIAGTKGLTMGYYDGNTTTAMWNYAQHYAMNDHSFSSTFGPSTPGAINLISGQTNGVVPSSPTSSSVVPDGSGSFTLISDSDPTGDVCTPGSSAAMTGTNIGDLLNAKGVTWGWFQGGFNLGITNTNGTTGCSRSTVSPVVGTIPDYVQHHQPFQYYKSTQNLTHARPNSVASIGTTDSANHQYDTLDFTATLAAGNLPAVSFLKAPAFQDGHPGNSDPLDEQTFVVNTINAIQQSAFWSSTAIIIAYDDSDGWYDHMSDLVNGSTTAADTINGAGVCISATAAGNALPGILSTTLHAQGRCGYGPRQPLLVISPWAKKNYISSIVTDQSSITRFIEDTFLGSQRIGGGSFDSVAGSLNDMFNFTNSAVVPNPNVVLLNPATGLVTTGN